PRSPPSFPTRRSSDLKGFYDYPEKPAKKHLWPGLKDLYPQQDADKIDVEELKQRFLAVIALEAVRVMEEGIVTDPREADVGSIRSEEHTSELQSRENL